LAATPRYTTRLDSPHLIELGQTTVLVCPVYYQGALVTPSAGTITISDAGQAAVISAAAVTISGGIAQYTVSSGTTASLSPSSGWRVLWSLTLPGSIPWLQRTEAYLVRQRLYPTIADADVARRVPALATQNQGRPTASASYQGLIEEADAEVQRRLRAAGRRPWLVMSPADLRESWLTYTLALIYDSLAGQGSPTDPYAERAAHYRAAFEAAWAQAALTMDWDQDGYQDSTERVSAKPAGVWLC
jgi:hypothetical protein